MTLFFPSEISAIPINRYMPEINFFKLCESVLEEANRAHLFDIARQAKNWRKKYSQAKTLRDRADAREQLIVLQDFLRDEFGRDLNGDEFTAAIEASSFYNNGLLNLTPVMISKLR